MGDWSISISGIGANFNGISSADADLAARKFVSKLRSMNQTITSATFCCGDKMVDLNPPQPTGKQVLDAVTANLSSRLFHKIKAAGKLGGQFNWDATKIVGLHTLSDKKRVGFYAWTKVDGDSFGVSMDFLDTQIYLGDIKEALYEMTKTLKDTLSSPGREPPYGSAEEAVAATEQFFSYLPKGA